MRFQIKSEGYPEKNMDIKGYVNYYKNFVEQGWIINKPRLFMSNI